jgi:hypothetical protein
MLYVVTVTVLCSPALCEWLLCSSRAVNRIELYIAVCCVCDLLYCECVVTIMQLNVMLFVLSGSDIVGLSSPTYFLTPCSTVLLRS